MSENDDKGAEAERGWLARGLPMLGAATKLLGTLQRFGLALYERFHADDVDGDNFAFVAPMLEEFLEGLGELKESLPEKETIFLALENIEAIVAEVASHPTAKAMGARIQEVVAARSDEVIGKVMEASFFAGNKSEPVSPDVVRVLGRIEELLDEAIARWILPDEEKR